MHVRNIKNFNPFYFLMKFPCMIFLTKERMHNDYDNKNRAVQHNLFDKVSGFVVPSPKGKAHI